MKSKRTKEHAEAVRILRQFEADVIQRVVSPYTDWLHDLMNDYIKREYTPSDWYEDETISGILKRTGLPEDISEEELEIEKELQTNQQIHEQN